MSVRDAYRWRSLGGFSYVEVLIATVLVALALVPLLDALSLGLRASAGQASQAALRHRLAGKLEEVLARPYAELAVEAFAAGGSASAYSDPVATPQRRLVYLSGFDADDADGDGDPTTGADPGILRVRVEAEHTALALESLARW